MEKSDLYLQEEEKEEKEREVRGREKEDRAVSNSIMNGFCFYIKVTENEKDMEEERRKTARERGGERGEEASGCSPPLQSEALAGFVWCDQTDDTKTC